MSIDIGFAFGQPEYKHHALLEGGPLHGEVMRTDVVQDREYEDGWYKLDPACTDISSGERRAFFRWVKDLQPDKRDRAEQV